MTSLRQPAPTDFVLELPGVGRFIYARKTFGDRIRIRALLLQLTNGIDGDLDLTLMAEIVAMHTVLCVSAPKGWEDLSAIESSDPEWLDSQMLALYNALRTKEDSFRQRPNPALQGGGQGAGGDGGVLAPPEVPAVAT